MSHSLVVPDGVLSQHLVVLGKTGSGKSSVLRHIVEHLLSRKKRVCIVDPKGDWYGLKGSPDGKGAGFPVILFGDFKDNFKSDVPLIPRSQLDDDEVDLTPAAKHVATLVVSGNRPCVLGMRGWTQGNMTRFWIDFASGIFNGESGELYFVIDEGHNFAPKGKLFGIEARRALHWTNRIMNEGRGIGLVNLIASQRPQKVHNDTLTACETLIAMRVVHTADRKAVEEWIKGCGDEGSGGVVLKQLAGQGKGEGFVWSPEVNFGPERIQFPMFTTFDSFAPARLQKSVREEGWASGNLDEVKEKLATVIEKAKAEDPKELDKVIAGLRQEIARLQRGASSKPQDTQKIQQLETALQTAREHVKEKVKVVERRIIISKDVSRLEALVKRSEALLEQSTSNSTELQNVSKQLSEILAEVKVINDQELKTVALAPSVPVVPAPASVNVSRLNQATGAHSIATPTSVVIPARPSSNGAQDLSERARKMLTALAQSPEGLTKAQILLHSNYKASGKVSSTFAEFIRNGWAEPRQPPAPTGLQITPAGLSALGTYERLPTGSALREHLLASDKLRPLEKALLKPILAAYPNAITKGKILQDAGYAASGKVSETFARLVRYGYARKSGASLLTASSELFD
jgi:hypothetical protein